ncbi:hypothetical protein ACFE04_011847 [Oxalis oulophora]
MGGEERESKMETETETTPLVTVNVRYSNGTKMSVRTNLESTVFEFKSIVAQNCDVPADQQRLIYKGRILKDDQTLSSYGLQADHTVHMVRGQAATPSPPAGNTQSNPGAGNTQTSPGAGNTQTSTPGAGNTQGAQNARQGLPSLEELLEAQLFPGLGFNPLGGAGLPNIEQMQQQLTQNPNMLRDLMNTPAVRNMMDSPELMRSLIMSNPQMRELIDRNPELGHVLNDPSLIRQTLETARNPELMREMMRNTDRAMSNIEASPEGFNMLRRMYENVQEPFLNATSAGNDLNSNPFSALAGNQAGNQATNASNTASETTTGNTVPNANPLPNPWSNTGANTTARSAQTPSARAPSPAGLGGLGLGDIGSVLGSDQLSQMLQNPAMSQMMQTVLSNPQYMNQILNLNQQFQENPQLREMIQNSESFGQLTSPESMQRLRTLQQSLASQLRQQSIQGLGQPGSNTEAPGLDMLMNMFGDLGSGGLSGLRQPNVPPEERYATQLSQLQEMGFSDTQANIRALQATSGNINAAIERLLGNTGQ